MRRGEPTTTTSTTASCASASRSGATAAYLHVWAAGLAAYAILLRFVPPRPGGVWDLGNTLIGAAAGLVVVAGSVWMVYTLEILKARHLRVLGFSRFAAEPEDEREEAVEEVITAGRH